jgi:hypothetical protein
MNVAITLCNETDHERHQNKHDNLFLLGSKSQSLPRLIQFAVFLQTYSFCTGRIITDERQTRLGTSRIVQGTGGLNPPAPIRSTMRLGRQTLP